MIFKPIGIEDKEIIQSFFKKEPCRISDISFTNLYLWHFSRSISYCIIEDLLCIKTKYPNQEPFIFMPIGIGDKKKVLKLVMDYFKEKNYLFSLHSLSQEMKNELEYIMPHTFTYHHNRDRSDYIYLIEELIALKGRKFHKKKNHLNQFYELYPHHSYEALSIDNRDELLSVWKEWFKNQKVTEGLKNEYIGVCNVLEHFEKLCFKGGLIRVSGKIVAFSFGEALDDEMVVIHIEKADIAYHGSYQAINQLFLKNQWSMYRYVNREEDLGLEGLRKAKMSYQPCFMLDKYDAFLSNI